VLFVTFKKLKYFLDCVLDVFYLSTKEKTQITKSLTTLLTLSLISSIDYYKQNIMAFTTGYPANETTAYTLVIPRVFGNNGHRNGVTNNDVFDVMSSQKWGILQGIDCHEKKDFRTGENFRMMFVRWAHFAPPADVKKAFEDGGHVEVDIDDYGHFWKVRKFVPRVKSDVSEVTNEVRVYSTSGEKKNVSKEFPILGNPKNVKFAGVWDDNGEFSDEMTAFCESGLSVEELKIADDLQDSFDLIMMQNTLGDVNEA
jgi:hypothetical protein